MRKRLKLFAVDLHCGFFFFFGGGGQEETFFIFSFVPFDPSQFSRAPTIQNNHSLDSETKNENNHTNHQDAEEAESSGSPATARAMVSAVVSLGVEDADRERTWLADASDLTKRNSFSCAREVAAAALGAFPGKPGVWRAAVAVEKAAAAGASGDAEAAAAAVATVDALLQKAVSYCPEVSVYFFPVSFEQTKPLLAASSPARAPKKIQNAWQCGPFLREGKLKYLPYNDRPRREPKREKSSGGGNSFLLS